MTDDHQLSTPQDRAVVFNEVPRRSHLVIAQEGWQKVTEYALSWVLAKIGSKLPRRAA